MSSPVVDISEISTAPESQLIMPNDIKTLFLSFLGRRNSSYPSPRLKIDSEYAALCAEEARRRGYTMEGTHSLAPYIAICAMMASTAYAHVENQSTRILMALYTACVVYADNVFQNDAKILRTFNQLFADGRPQANPILDALAHIIHEIHQHFDSIAANMAILSALGYITALILEMETQQMKICPEAARYPAFAWSMSGFPDVLAIWIFPRELPITAFVQALSDMRVFINYANDILSFYKEELAGETINYVSQVAANQGISKLDAL